MPFDSWNTPADDAFVIAFSFYNWCFSGDLHFVNKRVPLALLSKKLSEKES